jgi:signal transduction histidine kinase
MSAVNMIKDKVDSHDIAELLNLLDISVSRLESFTFATNQLARLQDVNKDIEHKKVSLRELIEITFIDKKNALDDTGISVSMNEDSPVGYVSGDYDLLLSCMGILLMNLVNNMHDGGSLDFETGQLNGSTWVDINIENPGYTPGQIKTLENILSGSENNESHFGLELILSREIITSHKGKIKFEEKGEGSFSTRLLFPSCKTD